MREENLVITGCVRANGSIYAKTSDTKNRYLGTGHGSKIEMTIKAANIKDGSKQQLSVMNEFTILVTIEI